MCLCRGYLYIILCSPALRCCYLHFSRWGNWDVEVVWLKKRRHQELDDAGQQIATAHVCSARREILALVAWVPSTAAGSLRKCFCWFTVLIYPLDDNVLREVFTWLMNAFLVTEGRTLLSQAGLSRHGAPRLGCSGYSHRTQKLWFYFPNQVQGHYYFHSRKQCQLAFIIYALRKQEMPFVPVGAFWDTAL